MTRRLLLALVLIIIAAPRSAQQVATPVTTARQAAEPPGAPRSEAESRRPGATGELPGGSARPVLGALPSYTVLDAMVEAEIGSVLLRGKASWMPEKYGPDYLAMRLPKGTEVIICAATCLDMVVNDYGPSKRLYPDRIADIAVIRWEQICEIPRRWGICEITVEYGGGPRATLPPTDLP